MEYTIEYERTVTFRTTITARSGDVAYDRALAAGDALDGDPVAYGPIDEFSIVVPEAAAVTG